MEEPPFSSEDEALFKDHESPFKGIPDALFDLLNQYTASDGFRDCTAAVDQLLAAKISMHTADFWRAVRDGLDWRIHLAEHSKHCYTALAELKLPTAPRNYLKEFEAYVLRAGVFILKSDKYGGRVPVCGGIRVNAAQVLTAKHCFYREFRWNIERARWSTAEKSDAEIGVALGVPAGMDFVEFRDLGQRLKVTRLVAESPGSIMYFPMDASKKAEDHVLVEVELPPAGDEPDLRLSEPKQWDRIIFLTLPPSEEVIRAISSAVRPGQPRPAGATAPVSGLSHIRVDDSANCYVYAVANGCLFYNCQTLNGMSGSPLITVDGDDGVSVIGVHTSWETRPQEFPCGFTRAKWMANSGVAAPTK